MLKTKSETLAGKHKKYQYMTESFIFLMMEIKHDIAFSTLVASYFSKKPLY